MSLLLWEGLRSSICRVLWVVYVQLRILRSLPARRVQRSDGAVRAAMQDVNWWTSVSRRSGSAALARPRVFVIERRETQGTVVRPNVAHESCAVIAWSEQRV